MSDTDVPDSVTYREIQEILRTFRDSSWRSISLDLHGMRITVGKDGPPAGSAPAAAAPPAAAQEPAPPVAVAPPARTPVAPTTGASISPAPPATGPAVDTTGCVEVRSPAVGAFWIAPSPGQPPFVEIGQTVTVDEQLAIVEVMKLMNPVVAPVAGEVVAVNAANADLVEYEQVLFWIRPGG